MEFLLLPLLTVCLLSCSGTTSAQKGSVVVKVEEGSEAILPCFIRPEKNIADQYFNWRKVVQKDVNQEVFECNKGTQDTSSQNEKFKGRVFNFPDQLQSGNASIRIRDTKWSDSGNYTCDFPRLQPKGQKFYIELVVGACPTPFLAAHDQSKDVSLLKCEVQSVSPKPKVELKDSAGNVLPAEETQVTKRGSNYDIFQTTVTKTDSYNCVVTQEEICHQVSEEIPVHFSDSSPGLAADVVATFAITVFGVLVKCYITQN